MSNNTLNAALRRLGYSKQEVSVSGFRATVSALLNETGRWNPDAIERQLAHMEENDVRRLHAAEFWNERVEMMQVWADYLDQLRYGSSVVDRQIRPLAHSLGRKQPSQGRNRGSIPLGSANCFKHLDGFSSDGCCASPTLLQRTKCAR
jgi:hypothetical protein